jgi:hypothetical protein
MKKDLCVDLEATLETPRSGPIVFLPETRLSREAIHDIVLRHFLKIQRRQAEPSWAADVVAPGQRDLDSNLATLRAENASLNDRIRAISDARAATREVLRLLLDTGIGLEEVVRRAFEALGATVEAPDNPGKEDGWMTVMLPEGHDGRRGHRPHPGAFSRRIRLTARRGFADELTSMRAHL